MLDPPLCFASVVIIGLCHQAEIYSIFFLLLFKYLIFLEYANCEWRALETLIPFQVLFCGLIYVAIKLSTEFSIV